MLAINRDLDIAVVRRSTRYFMLVGVLWSACGILFQDIRWNLMAVFAVRSLIGAIVGTVVLRRFLKNRYSLSDRQSFAMALQGIFGYPNRVHWLGAIVACVNVAALMVCFKWASATSAGFFQASGVLWIGALSGLFLKEKPRKADWVAMSIAMVGMGFLTWDSFHLGAWQGTVVGIFCSLTLAFGQICYKRRSLDSPSGYGSLEMSILSDIIGVLLGAPFLLQAGVPSAHDCWMILVLCTLAWTLPSTIYVVCVKDLPIFRAFLLTLLDPVLTPVWPWAFHGVWPSVASAIGAGIVTLGILYQGLSLAFFERKAASMQPIGLME